ncbi:MAG: sigma-70 family RNA polymerase sigma factor [Planctomycetaceae bacterium]|nr:sigma-70 family RNA polymerase sigma factor [Planctomycetaceae bacterium]
MSDADSAKLDASVVAALYVEHGEELRRFLQGILRDGQLAADVLQATFVKMAERGHETKVESRKAWLFRVAFNEAMAVRRREAVGDKIVRNMAEQVPAWRLNGMHQNGMERQADDPLVRLESVEAVREAMSQLPPEQRQLVRMRIYEEKTFAVIAKELSIPLGTALARMRAALIKLRAKLTTNEPLESQQGPESDEK